MKLLFKKETRGIYYKHWDRGDVISYYPWDGVWQGMTEQERVEKGIFVHCQGQGEFDVFTLDNVIPLADELIYEVIEELEKQ